MEKNEFFATKLKVCLLWRKDKSQMISLEYLENYVGGIFEKMHSLYSVPKTRITKADNGDFLIPLDELGKERSSYLFNVMKNSIEYPYLIALNDYYIIVFYYNIEEIINETS